MTVDWLASDEGQAVIQGLRGVDPLHARQVYPELDYELVTAALTQAKHRPPDFPLPLVTQTGIQQSTPVDVARRRAQRLVQRGVTDIVDAGCGIGVDSWAFAHAGLRVVAYEVDPATAAIARVNLAGLNVEVIQGDVTECGLPAGALYVDPARRQGHHGIDGRPIRINDPLQWSPPWDWVLEQTRQRSVVARVRPGMQDLPNDAEWRCSSIQRSLVDATLWFGQLARDDRAAEVLADDWHELTGPAPMPRTGPIGAYIIDPDPAIVRAGVVSLAAEHCGGHLIDKHLAYITCDDPPAAWLGRAMRVLEQVHPKQVKQAMQRHGLRSATVWARGFTRRPLTDVPHGQEAILVAARVGEQRSITVWLGSPAQRT